MANVTIPGIATEAKSARQNIQGGRTTLVLLVYVESLQYISVVPSSGWLECRGTLALESAGKTVDLASTPMAPNSAITAATTAAIAIRSDVESECLDRDI